MLRVILQEDVEEKRLDAAMVAMPEIFDSWHPEENAAAQPLESGTRLWRDACKAVQAGRPDDRFLYWRRLATRRLIRRQLGDASQPALAAFEHASRGFDDLNFLDDSSLKILVTGFDPFRLYEHLDQSNPSGYLAQLVNEQALELGGVPAQIKTCVIPVRYADFDDGLIESLMQRVSADRNLDLLLTVSMGRTGFDLERFPGLRRSVEGPDNLDLMSGGSATSPAIPGLADDLLKGPEFVEFSLPANQLLKIQQPYPVHDNREVTTLEKRTLQAASLDELSGLTAVSGSGGGYLSNEISYRAINWFQQHEKALTAGHIHTPKMAGYHKDSLLAIARQLQALIDVAARSLVE